MANEPRMLRNAKYLRGNALYRVFRPQSEHRMGLQHDYVIFSITHDFDEIDLQADDKVVASRRVPFVEVTGVMIRDGKLERDEHGSLEERSWHLWHDDDVWIGDEYRGE